MKKVIAGLLVLAVLALGLWVRAYRAYERAEQGAIALLRAGDGKGALETIHGYLTSVDSYPVRNIARLGTFHKRLRYHEGVGYLVVGDNASAEGALRDAAQSSESGIAAKASYNLADIALRRDDLETARAHVSRSLELNPVDVEAKVNLELLLKKIQAESSGEDKGKGKGVPVPGQSDLWRLDIPQYDSPSSGGSNRTYR